jgi:UDP-N-acetylglucosamine 2-epimerase (non-hydrolysing)
MRRARLKVVTVLGTRPEIIRLSQVIRRLDEHTDHVLVHTGQNYDESLNEVFFRDLRLRKPDHLLNVDPASVGTVYADVLVGTEQVLRAEQPDALLVLGDTNTAIAALVAKRMRVPVYHMEAGNRAFDLNVPEEINRRVVDHIADFNLVYTERSRQHLLAEGLPARRIYLTGSPLREVLDAHRDAIAESRALRELGLPRGGYFLASIHREENVDHPDRLAAVLNSLARLSSAYNLPVVLSTHPRTRKRLAALGVDHPAIRYMPPFGFLAYVRLQLGARCVVSDSGSISEESAILGFPAVTLRDSMERPEALDAGSVLMSALESDALLNSMEVVLSDAPLAGSVPPEYGITDTSRRVLRLITSTARLSNAWSGVRTAVGS